MGTKDSRRVQSGFQAGSKRARWRKDGRKQKTDKRLKLWIHSHLLSIFSMIKTNCHRCAVAIAVISVAVIAVIASPPSSPHSLRQSLRKEEQEEEEEEEEIKADRVE